MKQRATVGLASGLYQQCNLMIVSLLSSVVCNGAIAAEPHPQTLETAYRQGAPNRDGIGKFYLGREISHVMGHRGARWLERPAREREERTDLLIAGLPVGVDDVVADIGAGTGYFSFPLARRVSRGRILAVDIQPEMLAIIELKKTSLGVTNVEAVQGMITDPGLEANSVDLAFIVDAYHEFSHPLEMGRAIVNALRPGGKLVLIEYRGEDPGIPIKRLHKMTEAQARLEMAAVGLEWVETGTYLPQQHVLVFTKPDKPVVRPAG